MKNGKNFFKRTLAVLLVAVMLVGMAPLESLMGIDFGGMFGIEAEATQSRSDNFNKNYTLINKGTKDIVTVAKAQLGMTKSNLKYSEDWCADFVGDCAKLANQSAAIPSNGGCRELYNAVIKAGGISVNGRQAGDLIFYYCNTCKKYVHVGIVIDSKYSIEGNYYINNVSAVRKVSTYCHWSKTYEAYHYTSKGTVVRKFVRPNYSDSNPVSSITITNNTISEITNTSATISAALNKSTTVSSYGYYLSTTKANVSDHKSGFDYTVKSASSSIKDLSADLIKLTPNTKYHYRFWAVVGSKTIYSNVSDFTTAKTVPSTTSIKTSTPNVGIGDTASFTWSSSANTDSYIVNIYKSNGSLWKSSGTLKGNSYVSPAINEEGTYTAKIISVNSADSVTGTNTTFEVKGDVTATFYDSLSNAVMKKEIVHYGHSATAPKAAEHQGYTFSKWVGNYSGITSNVSIIAQYSANTYTVKFVNSVTNQILKTQRVQYMSAATPPADVVAPTGNTFKGWDTDYTLIKGDTTIRTIFEWYDSAYPVYNTFNSVTRNQTKAGYDVSVTVTASRVVSGRLVVALKSSGGALLNSTESAAFALSAGESKTLSVFVPYGSLAYKAVIYAINNYGSNGLISQTITQNIDNSSAWSSWIPYTGSVPVTQGVNGVSAVETKSSTAPTLYYYRYNTKTTTQSYATSISGWTQNGGSWVQSGSGTINYVPSWPAGFLKTHSLYTTYNKTPKTASETTSTKTTVSTSTLGYIYWHWCNYYAYGPTNRWIEFSKTGKYTTFHAFYSTTAQSYNSSADAYKFSNASACTGTYWWNGHTSGTPGLVTVKRCSYVDYNKLFNYYKISSWSNWIQYTGSVPVTAGSGTGTANQTYNSIETKSVPGATTYYYRYKTTQAVAEPTLTPNQVVDINGNVSNEYAGKKAVVWVYKYDQTSDYTTEYLSDEITIGANGAVSISNAKLYQEPTIVSGDYTIAVSVKGMTDSVYLGTIEAPKPSYTVTFYNYDGTTPVSVQTIIQGGNALVPSADELSVIEGYRFTNWSQSTVNVQSDLSVYPEREKETFVVAFVDWGAKSVELKEFEYGAELITPLLAETEDGITATWNFTNVPTDANGAYIVTSNMAVTTNYETQTKEIVFYGTDYDENTTNASENASVISNQTVEYGDRLDVPEPDEDVIILDWINETTGEELDDTVVTESAAYFPIFVFEETVENPSASVDSGVYSAAQTIELNCEDENAVIYYTIDGSDPKLTGIEYTSPITVNESIELKMVACALGKNDSEEVNYYYAVNTNPSATSKCLVSVVGMGQEQYYTFFANVGETVDIDPTDYEIEGYTLLGFYTDESFTNEWNIETDVVTQSMTLFPNWAAKQYSVTFKDADGSVLSTLTVSYSESAQAPIPTPPDGYAFNGWSSDDYLFVENNIEVTAKYILESEVVIVSLNRTTYAMMAGSMYRLNATVLPETAIDTSVIWSSSDEGIAWVDDDGVVTAVAKGVVEITATSPVNDASATCKIYVSANLQNEICLIGGTPYGFDSAGNIRGIRASENTVLLVAANFANPELSFVDRNGNILASDDLVGTGTKVILNDNGEQTDEALIVMTGDMNGDGLINNRDVSLISRYLVSKETADICQLCAMDANGDGYVNNRDASMLSRYLVGKENI